MAPSSALFLWILGLLACVSINAQSQTTFLKPIRENVLRFRSDLMYPYPKEDVKREIQDMNPLLAIQFNFYIPFFGFRFNYTWVSLFGGIYFSRADDLQRYPLKYPNDEWPNKRDPAFIGIFLAHALVGEADDAKSKRDRPPGVYFKIYENIGASKVQADIDLHEAIRLDVQHGMIGTTDFRPKHILIATWKNITFGGSANRFKTNTYQLMLATDEYRTYAIFNYQNITWTSSTSANGGAQDGRGGTAAYVGFNAGNGTRAFEYKPYSQTNRVIQLVNHGGINGHPGRHIFRIDELIQQGSCNFEPTQLSKLIISPESGHMLGGTIVNITGPCFEKDRRIKIKFHDQEVTCIFQNRNVATCQTPPVYIAGYVDVTAMIGEGSFQFRNKFYIENPMVSTELVWFEKRTLLNSLDLGSFNLYWSKSNISWTESKNVQISLWGYREIGRIPQLVYIDHLKTDVNSGISYIDVTKFYKNDNGWKKNLTVGFIQVNSTYRTDSNDILANVLWSRPIPLGWYFAPQLKAQYSPDWYQVKCAEWVSEDNKRPPLQTDSISPCPCTLDQAQNDKGQFMPDSQCDVSGENDCYGNEKLLHCVVSTQPDSSGHGQHCCYGVDNMLLTPTDTKQVYGFPSRAHPFGQHPYNVAGKVPGLSYWYQDVAGYFACCDWSKGNDTCYNHFMKLRPSNDCTGYKRGNTSQVYGDPHFITNDATEFTFNGKGEFSLVNVHNKNHHFDVQARFEQYMDLNKYVKMPATIITSVVVKGNHTSTVEIQHQPSGLSSSKRLRVLIDKKSILLMKSSQKVVISNGATVYTAAKVRDQWSVVVAFDSGAGVEVFNINDNIAVRIYLPRSFMAQTRGLLGNWTNNGADDLVTPDGQILEKPNIRNIHTEFGMKWMVSDQETWGQGSRSLFFHERGRSSSFYNDPEFRPILEERPPIDPPSGFDEIDVMRTCAGTKACYYDYAVTENKNFGQATALLRTDYYNQRLGVSDINLCPAISPRPRMRMSSSSRIVGTEVAFECELGFVLQGNPITSCLPSLQWSPQPNPTCEPE